MFKKTFLVTFKITKFVLFYFLYALYICFMIFIWCFAASAGNDDRKETYEYGSGELNNFTLGSYTPSCSDFAASRESRMPGH